MRRKLAAVDSAGYPIVRIEPASAISLPSIGELWRWRELFILLAWRDIRVRYKQALLGVLWALLTPFALMAVFTLFFGVIFATPSAGVARPVFIFAGLITWILFSESMDSVSNSLLKDRHIFEKLYFPRLIIPFSSVVSNLLDFAFAFIALLVMMIGFGVPLLASSLLSLFWALVAVLIALSVGIWLAALNLQYSDFRHITPLLLQLWFYSTPIFYPVSAIPEQWQPLYRLNPMVGVVEGMRWAMFNTEPPSILSILLSLIPVTIFLITGILYFLHHESTFAENL
jgi:lipopolysaccharide transport system permease protein